MSEPDLKRCLYCGKAEHQTEGLRSLNNGHVCKACEKLWTNLYGEGSVEIGRRQRDGAVFDDYRQYELEIANQSSLQSEYHTPVEEPKNPVDKERLRAMQNSHELGQGLRQHPLLADKVQFSGLSESLILPTMSEEQAEKYLQLQLDLQNQKRLEKTNEQIMRASPI